MEVISPYRTPDRVRQLTAEDLVADETTAPAATPGVSILSIVVEGLLSFGEMTSFEFGKLNILVGPNGSGKSNLIDCFRLLRNAPTDIQLTFKDSGFDDWLYNGNSRRTETGIVAVTVALPELPLAIVHQVRLGPPINSRALVEEHIASSHKEGIPGDDYYVGSQRFGAKLTVRTSSKRRRVRYIPAQEYNPFQSVLSQIRDTSQFPEISRLARLYMSFPIYSEWAFGRSSSLREATPAGRADTLLSDSMDNLALVLNALANGTAHEQIKNLLAEIKESYRDFNTRVVFGRIGFDLLEESSERPIPASRLSDGTLRFIALASILLHPEIPPVILLEEPELGMHPDMIRTIARMIQGASRKSQIILSTHSELLLSALQDDFDAMFAFDTGLTGSIIRRFDKTDFVHWRSEHNLGELWTSGELGGNRW